MDFYIIAQKRRMSGTFKDQSEAQTKHYLWISLMCQGVFMTTFQCYMGIYILIYS